MKTTKRATGKGRRVTLRQRADRFAATFVDDVSILPTNHADMRAWLHIAYAKGFMSGRASMKTATLPARATKKGRTK